MQMRTVRKIFQSRFLMPLPLPRRAAVLIAAAILAVAACTPATKPKAAKPEAGVVNVYSARHYDADAAIFKAFTAQTGITVQTLEAPGDQLIARLKAEGADSPADVIITVDAGNLWKLTQENLLQPAASPTLTAAVPANLRDPEGRWFGFSKRLRAIVYAKDRVKPDEVATLAALTGARFKKKICARTSTQVYNQSTLAGMIEREGAPAAGAWAKAMVANFARDPQGNDTDQIKAIAAGVCDAAIVNHYYLIRMQTSADPADQAVAAQVGLAFPDQAGAGAPVNVSGAGMAANAKNKDNAQKLLDFLASPEAQKEFAALNDEFPVVAGAALPPALAALGTPKETNVPLVSYGQRQAEAQKLFDDAGWR
jgi:iron(III) transport system substrate-binding protein